MKKIKELYEKSNGSTKFMFILVIFFTITNVAIIIWSNILCRETAETVNEFFDKKRDLFAYFGLSVMIDKFKEIENFLLLILFNFLGYCVSYWIGKLFGFFKSIAEFFDDIRADGKKAFAFTLYNVISMLLDMYTICSFIIIK